VAHVYEKYGPNVDARYEDDGALIAALINAYRSGCLVSRTAAQAAPDGTGLECKNCGSRKDLKEIQAEGYRSCCPERDMVPLAAAPAAPAQGGGDGWQPISTAPLGIHEFECDGSIGTGIDIAHDGAGTALFLIWWTPDGIDSGVSRMTHWRPMPAPPSTEIEGR
jgi:hypothetical protein